MAAAASPSTSGAHTVQTVSNDAGAELAKKKCRHWHDRKGPGGAYRQHVKCGKKWDVKVAVGCKGGSKEYSKWRRNYQKAECPSGRNAKWSYWWVRKHH